MDESDNSDAKGNDEILSWTDEVKAQQKVIQKAFGWHFQAKAVADYLNMKVFDVMKADAEDVFGWMTVMKGAVQLEQLSNAK